MKVGVVILNYNDSDRAINLSNKISEYSLIDLILIVDNCSTDGSYQKLHESFKGSKKIEVLKTKKNGGYAYGNNFGVNYLSAMDFDIAFISNTDVDFDMNYVNSCINCIASGYSMASGIMQFTDGSFPTQRSYYINTYFDDLIDCFYLGRLILKKKKEKAVDLIDKKIIDVEMLPGSLFAVEIDSFNQVEGFDEGTFLYCEERILGAKMKTENYKIGLLLDVSYLHNHSMSISKRFDVVNKMKIMLASRLYYLVKYSKISKMKKIIFEVSSKICIFEFKVRRLISKIM